MPAPAWCAIRGTTSAARIPSKRCSARAAAGTSASTFGAGVGFALGDSGEFYVESKYRYVWGPEIVSATPLPSSAGTGGNANGQYLPLTFGFRF